MTTSTDVDIETLEAAMAQGWWPLEHERLGDWLLRASGGFTGRGNSALPLGDPGLPLEDAVVQVEQFYRERSLAPRFSVPGPVVGDVSRGPLASVLSARGYAVQTPTAVMVAEAAGVLDHTAGRGGEGGGGDDGVVVRPRPDDGWLSLYRYRGQPLPAQARRLLTSAPFQRFASVLDDGQTVAVGRLAVGGGWAGITGMEVAESHRRRGLARRVLAALARQAVEAGVGRLYLQVDARNEPARALYASTGFRDHHGYHYRVLADD